MDWKFGLVAVLILAALCGIGWWWWNHIHPPGPDCLMLSHEKTSGINFSFTIDKVKSLQATLGLTDKDVRDFDDLLKDYGAKYETICKDYSVLHVVTSGEYNCRRDNMDKTLDSIRALREVLGKSSGDVANASAKKYIESILDAAHGSFMSGCGAHNHRFECRKPGRNFRCYRNTSMSSAGPTDWGTQPRGISQHHSLAYLLCRALRFIHVHDRRQF